jgi:uncharacterized protein YjhX (UPF0386 family)
MTRDHEAERIRRIRERAFYLSLVRPAPPDPVADWIEAEAAEAAAEPPAPDPPAPEPPAPEPPAPEPPAPEPPAPDPLARYPHLAEVVARSKPALDSSRLAARAEHAARADDHVALDRLDRDLHLLATRFKPGEIERLSDALVSTTTDSIDAEVGWDLATMQIHLFAALQRRELLQSIGVRPARRVTRAEPHRCTIGPRGVSLSVEAQPDLGAGFHELRNAVDALTQRAAIAKGAAWKSTLWYRGELTGVRGPATADALASLEAELLASPARPSAALPLALGSAVFDVFVSDESAEAPTTLLSQMLPSFKKLLETRAQEDAPFLLANVRLPPAPGESDAALPPTLELVAKKASAGAALLANSASSLWLGLLELDLRAADPRLRLIVRPAASWPLPYRDLATSLDATLAVL